MQSKLRGREGNVVGYSRLSRLDLVKRDGQSVSGAERGSCRRLHRFPGHARWNPQPFKKRHYWIRHVLTLLGVSVTSSPPDLGVSFDESLSHLPAPAQPPFRSMLLLV